MFLPEYSITQKILANVAQIEYSRAIISNTPILPAWEKQLKKDARIRSINNSLRLLGYNADNESIKRYLDGINNKAAREIRLINSSFEYADNLGVCELEEKDLKEIHKHVGGTQEAGAFRKRKKENATHPEEILAEMVEFMDWFNSLDAKETHPILIGGILYAVLETIIPFEPNNSLVSDLAVRIFLRNNGFGIKEYYCLEEWFNKSKWEYDRLIFFVAKQQEYTEWLEYFTEGLCQEFSNMKEKVMLLARDTKVAKASGRTKLTDRQERIIEYLQDYGIIQNKDFPQVFPGISEDSILRDLKTLMNKDIIVKTGSTKSSRYELS